MKINYISCGWRLTSAQGTHYTDPVKDEVCNFLDDLSNDSDDEGSKPLLDDADPKQGKLDGGKDDLSHNSDDEDSKQRQLDGGRDFWSDNSDDEDGEGLAAYYE